MTEPLKVFVLDTNTFLHYQPLTQINWRSVTGEQCGELWITTPVLTELEEKKASSGSKKLMLRAQAAIKLLSDIKKGIMASPEAFPVVFDNRDPLVDLEALGLDRRITDNRLLGRAIELRETRDVVLVTADLSLHLRAERFGLSTIEMAKTYTVEVEHESERELRALREENARLKLVHPRLRCCFEDGSQKFQVDIVEPLKLDEEEIQTYLKEMREEHHPRNRSIDGADPLFSLSNSLLGIRYGEIPEAEYERYNSELAAYHASLEARIGEVFEARNRERRTLGLQVFLENVGSKPAEEIELKVVASSKCRLHLTYPNHFANLPSPPQSPERPRLSSAFDEINSLSRLGSQTLGIERLVRSPTPKPTKPPEFRMAKDGSARLRLAKLPHGRRFKLPLLWIELAASATGATISAESYADNQPQMLLSKLGISTKLISDAEHKRRVIADLFARKKTIVDDAEEDEAENPSAS